MRVYKGWDSSMANVALLVQNGGKHSLWAAFPYPHPPWVLPPTLTLGEALPLFWDPPCEESAVVTQINAPSKVRHTRQFLFCPFEVINMQFWGLVWNSKCWWISYSHSKYEEQTCQCPVQPGVSHLGSGLKKSTLCLAPPTWRKVKKELTFNGVVKKKKSQWAFAGYPAPETLGSRQLEVFHTFPLILSGVVLDRMIQLSTRIALVPALCTDPDSYHHQRSKFYSFFS